jgi:hypothetical protein
MDALDVDPARQHLAVQREQRDGGEGLQREGFAERQQPEDVERDVDQEIQQPEGNTARVVPEESQPRCAAGEQARLAEEHDGEGEEQGAGDEGL